MRKRGVENATIYHGIIQKILKAFAFKSSNAIKSKKIKKAIQSRRKTTTRNLINEVE